MRYDDFRKVLKPLQWLKRKKKETQLTIPSGTGEVKLRCQFPAWLAGLESDNNDFWKKFDFLES